GRPENQRPSLSLRPVSIDRSYWPLQTPCKQQAKFDDFIDIFNNPHPHEALGMKYPAEVYQPSTRSYLGLPDIDYPSTTKSWSSPIAAGSVWGAKRLTSAPRRSTSRKCTMISGWLALWITI